MHAGSIQKCAPPETALPLISLRTSANYPFSAVGYRRKSAKFLTVFIFLCCLAMLMWALCNPSPTTAFLHAEGKKRRLAADSFPDGTLRGGASPRAYLPATEDLLIPSSGCGRTGVAAPPLLSAQGLDLELISRVAGCELAFAVLPHTLPPTTTTTLQPCLSSPHCLHAVFPDARPQLCGTPMLTKLLCGLTREQCQGLI